MATQSTLASSAAGQPSGNVIRNRWVQLVVGIVGMVMIANLQYGWTLFVNPIRDKHQWEVAAIQVAFSTFVLFETWLVPFETYLVDRFGPTLLVAVGGVLVAVAWWMNSVADSLTVLYVAGAIGGLGAGVVYGTAVGNALKWFTDLRGLAAGLTAAGFGAGSALTVVPIANMIKSNGYEATFLAFGLLQGVVVILAALLMRTPRPGEVPLRPEKTHVAQTTRDYSPVETVKRPVFWLLYLMMTLIGMGGLMATANLAPIAKDIGVDKSTVDLLLFGSVAVVPFALSLDRILNGLTRPFWGWVSDHIGREKAMTIVFLLEAAAISLLITTWTNPLLFALCSGLAFFGWGEIYSLFPAISGDLFGRQYASTNYGLLYTSKGMASLLVPIGAFLQSVTGSWVPIFLVAIAFDVTATVLAFAVLRRMAQAHLVRSGQVVGVPAFVPAVAGGSE
jgi:MFS transporter, OFA family, oxalate/formate antiporter